MEKSTRPQRNRRHSRRAWPPEEDIHNQDARPTKRLFTPDIKRMLKDWLVRRRENPYPSRDEKKRLAVQTGLTYTQICNWFANWRRKLKNSEREKAKKSWGQLIKHYNINARGNVEQFSISSEDSIWEEEAAGRDGRSKLRRQTVYYCDDYDEDDDEENDDEDDDELESRDEYSSGSCIDRSAGSDGNYNNETVSVIAGAATVSTTPIYAANFYVDSQTLTMAAIGTCNGALSSSLSWNSKVPTGKAKYKQQMMEKYLRDTSLNVDADANLDLLQQKQQALSPPPPSSAGAELNKWLQSAAKFTPNKNNYHIEWNSRRMAKHDNATHVLFTNSATTVARGEQPLPQTFGYCDVINTNNADATSAMHHKDELDAAEALANLAFNCRQRMLCTTIRS